MLNGEVVRKCPSRPYFIGELSLYYRCLGSTWQAGKFVRFGIVVGRKPLWPEMGLPESKIDLACPDASAMDMA